MKVGLIGCGAIGTTVALAIAEGRIPGVELLGIADPAAARNVHEIFVRGAFGEAAVRLANLPNPANPRSSYLAGLSVIATLRELGGTLHIGT